VEAGGRWRQEAGGRRQVEEVMRTVETLEQKIIEGDINKTKDEILDYVKKGLSENNDNIPMVTREENLKKTTDESTGVPKAAVIQMS
jgi:hypothetical protein